jgi:hypothetical protein
MYVGSNDGNPLVDGRGGRAGKSTPAGPDARGGFACPGSTYDEKKCTASLLLSRAATCSWQQ